MARYIAFRVTGTVAPLHSRTPYHRALACVLSDAVVTTVRKCVSAVLC